MHTLRDAAANVVRAARRVGLLAPPRSAPGGSYLRCAPPSASQALRDMLPRVAPHAEAILRSGVRSASDVSAIVDAASKAGLPQLAPDLPVGGVYTGVAQHDLYSVLYGIGATLATGGFRGHGDAASKTLLGPRGIGKTTALRAYAAVAPLFQPALVPVYVSYIVTGANRGGASTVTATVDRDSYYMTRNSLLVMVADALAVHGIRVRPELDSIVDGLAAHGKYALLLLDEMDKFYESQGDPAHKDNYAARFCVERQTLSELASLGNDARGRVAALLCGSSSLLSDLVTTNLRGTPGAIDDFPVLRVAINLNGQKFRTTRLTYSPPTDYGAVASMLQYSYTQERSGTVPLGSTGHSGDRVRFDAIVNAVLFCAGATARNVDRLITPRALLTARDLNALLMDDESAQAERTLKRAASKALYEGIMRALTVKNAALLNSLAPTPNGALSFDAVTSGNWQHTFDPLSWEEVCAIGHSHGIPDVAYEVAHLSDRDYIAYGDGTEGAHPSAVYPYTLLQLLGHGKSRAVLLTSTLEPIVTGLNSPQLRGPSAVDGAVIAADDSIVREAAKDAYTAAKESESLRDVAQRAFTYLSGVTGSD
jgi:hypothetical protein